VVGSLKTKKKEFKKRNHVMKSEEGRTSQLSTQQSDFLVQEERAGLWLFSLVSFTAVVLKLRVDHTTILAPSAILATGSSRKVP